MSNVNNSDLELLQQGSTEAFERLFHAYGGRLYNFVLKLSSGNTYLAEEMVQRTFVKIWEIHAKIDSNKSFISYLCTIAKNMLMNEYEHQTIVYIYNEYVQKSYSGAENTTDNMISYNLLEEQINQLIDQLPPARRQVFILSKKEMLSNKEIAAKLNITESTIQTQLSKAMLFLKENLAKYYGQILLTLIYYSVN